MYSPLWSPWLDTEFDPLWQLAAPRTIVSRERCYVLATMLRQAVRIDGEVWECGVYKGGTAALLARIAHEAGRITRLFDSFEGLPQADRARDLHVAGEFGDTTFESVRQYIKDPAQFHRGFMPATFVGLEQVRLCFAHLDVDLYRSVTDCLTFIWPRLAVGGVIVIDDYGFESCPGAKSAVDEFFAGTGIVPLCLGTGQAIVFKGFTV